MKKLIINTFGSNDVLEFSEETIPHLKANEVLVKVAYAGVNPLDWKTRNGEMKMVTGRKFPKMLGSEFSGVVAEIGSKVKSVSPGARVVGGMGMYNGAYSEFVVVKENHLTIIPNQLSLKKASISYVCGLTAYQCLIKKGQLSESKRVLINGAAGGVGTFGVQIARIAGAECWGVASNDNHDYLNSLGCTNTVDYNTPDWMNNLPDFDLIFDAVSKLSFNNVKPKLKPKGIYVNTFPGPEIFLQQLFTSIFPFRKAKTYLLKHDLYDLQWLFDHLVKQKIVIPELEVYQFDEIHLALEKSESQKTRGKMTIELDPMLK